MSKSNWDLVCKLHEGMGGFSLWREDKSGNYALGTHEDPPWCGEPMWLAKGKVMEVQRFNPLMGTGKHGRMVVKVPVYVDGGNPFSTFLTLQSAKLVHRHTGMSVVVDDDCQDDVGALIEMLVADPEPSEPEASDCQECPMERYRVVRKEICEVDYTIKARSPEHAALLVKQGHGKLVDDMPPTRMEPDGQPIGPSSSYPWEVCDKDGEGHSQYVDDVGEALDDGYGEEPRCGCQDPECSQCGV